MDRFKERELSFMGKTYIPKPSEIERKCWLIDANDRVLGRLATQVVILLMGKDEAFYTPHIECGDQVVVINAKGIRLTGRKAKTKVYQHYTGYPGGRHVTSFEEMQSQKPEFIVTEAVRRMLPKNRMRDKILKRLHVYGDEKHRQGAQKPVPIS